MIKLAASINKCRQVTNEVLRTKHQISTVHAVLQLREQDWHDTRIVWHLWYRLPVCLRNKVLEDSVPCAVTDNWIDGYPVGIHDNHIESMLRRAYLTLRAQAL